MRSATCSKYQLTFGHKFGCFEICGGGLVKQAGPESLKAEPPYIFLSVGFATSPPASPIQDYVMDSSNLRTKRVSPKLSAPVSHW